MWWYIDSFYTSNLSLRIEPIKIMWIKVLRSVSWMFSIYNSRHREGGRGTSIYCFHQNKSRTIYTSRFSKNDVYHIQRNTTVRVHWIKVALHINSVFTLKIDCQFRNKNPGSINSQNVCFHRLYSGCILNHPKKINILCIHNSTLIKVKFEKIYNSMIHGCNWEKMFDEAASATF